MSPEILKDVLALIGFLVVYKYVFGNAFAYVLGKLKETK